MNGLMLPMSGALQRHSLLFATARRAAARGAAPRAGRRRRPRRRSSASPRPRRRRAAQQPRRSAPPRPARSQPVAPPPPPLPPAVWDPRNAQDLLSLHPADRQRGAQPRRLRPGRADGRDAPAATRCACRPQRPTASTCCRRISRSAMSSGRARIDWYVADPRPRRRQAGCAAARRARASTRSPARCDGLLPTHPQYAALKAALAIDAGDRHGQARPHPAQHGPLALAAARPRRRNISSSTCPASTRRWSRTASTAGSSGRSPARPRPRRRS